MQMVSFQRFSRWLIASCKESKLMSKFHPKQIVIYLAISVLVTSFTCNFFINCPYSTEDSDGFIAKLSTTIFEIIFPLKYFMFNTLFGNVGLCFYYPLLLLLKIIGFWFILLNRLKTWQTILLSLALSPLNIFAVYFGGTLNSV